MTEYLPMPTMKDVSTLTLLLAAEEEIRKAAEELTDRGAMQANSEAANLLATARVRLLLAQYRLRPDKGAEEGD